MGDQEEAGYFYHDLTQVNGEENILFFPSSYRRAIKYGQKDAANEILRTEVLSRLQKGDTLCVVTYPDALAEKVVSQEELTDKTLKLSVGEHVDTEFIAEVLTGYGFEHVDYVYEPGQYAVRGSIIDVFLLLLNILIASISLVTRWIVSALLKWRISSRRKRSKA